jgi:cysteine sulfinate desulfinase/cysteine desulfurase-like protein
LLGTDRGGALEHFHAGLNQKRYFRAATVAVAVAVAFDAAFDVDSR